MAKTFINGNADLKNFVGKDLPPGDWVEVTQEMIDKFADATGDHQWIHVDVERAKKESPYKSTIAHGYLTLSLMAQLRAAALDMPPARALPVRAYGRSSIWPVSRSCRTTACRCDGTQPSTAKARTSQCSSRRPSCGVSSSRG